MNSLQESISKIRKIEEKLEKVRAQNKLIRQENKYLRRRTKELSASRDNWKQKLKDSRLIINKLEYKLKRGNKMKRHHYDTWIVLLCVRLRLLGGCSYKSICRILAVLNTTFEWEALRLPCANTIQNWVSKVGYYELQTTWAAHKGKKVSLIIDESIRLGKEKFLLILLVAQEKLKLGALKFKDVQVVYMKGSESWKSEKIKEVLQELQRKHEFHITHILSDEGSALKKAFKLVNVPHLPDMAHALAMCLQRTFSKSADYEVFIKLISAYQFKSVNQSLTYLIPPKQRVKARFMNQHRVVKWANQMLSSFDQISSGEQLFFAELPQHHALIQSLHVCMLLSKRVATLFRNFGLSEQTLQIVQAWQTSTTKTDTYVTAFVQHLQTYLTIYQYFMKQTELRCVEVSSEIIESLFGVYKEKAASCKLTGLTTLNLELPAHCMDAAHYETAIPIALEQTFVTDLHQWKIEHSSENQLVKRTNFFNNRT